MSVNRDLKKGFKWTAIMQFSVMGVQFMSTILLARLLSPSDFGVIGIIAIFVAIGDMLTDSGMGGALIKKQDATSLDYSTLFVYNMLVSIGLYLVIFFIAPFFSRFYEKPDLVVAIRALSSVVIINALSRVQYLKLLKSLSFKAISISMLTAHLFALLIASYFAYTGYGYWALIIQQISVSLILTIVYLFFNRSIPQIQFSIASFKEQFAFGAYLLGSQILTSITDNIHSNVLAKIIPVAQTGYFVQANKIKSVPVNFLTSIIDKTLFPVFSRISDPELFLRELRRLSIQLYSIIIPVIMFLIFHAYDIIALLLGKKWLEASWMLSLLFVGVIFSSVQIVSRNALKSKGYTKQIFHNEILKGTLILLFLFFTYKHGVLWIILGILAAHVFATIFIMWRVSVQVDYKFMRQVHDLLPILLINLLSLIALFLTFRFLFLDLTPLTRLIIGFGQHLLVILTISRLFNQRILIDMVFSLLNKFGISK